jgi:hypothetical protein
MPPPIAREKRMAQYKTITLELIQEQPELYERLRSGKLLLTAMDAYAIDLKASHEHWKKRLGRARPDSDPGQISSEALELAIEDLRHRLASASEGSAAESPFSLDEAMASVRRATPSA